MPTFWLPCPGKMNAVMNFSLRARLGPWAARLKSEGDNLVGSIVADIGPAEIGNPAARAPVLRNGDLVTTERTVVFRHVADPAEP